MTTEKKTGWHSTEGQDWRWLFEQHQAGLLQTYRGQHIAVVNRQIVGNHENALYLQTSVAEHLRLAPERLLIFYVD